MFSGGACGNNVSSFMADIKWVSKVCWCVFHREGGRESERETEKDRGSLPSNAFLMRPHISSSLKMSAILQKSKLAVENSFQSYPSFMGILEPSWIAPTKNVVIMHLICSTMQEVGFCLNYMGPSQDAGGITEGYEPSLSLYGITVNKTALTALQNIS